MTDPHPHAPPHNNLWAPWRMEYIDGLGAPEADGCFLCRHAENPNRDPENHVLLRGERVFAMLNRFPYTGGHMLVAPYEHAGRMAALDDAALLETMHMLRDVQALLRHAIHAEGFNVGLNAGHCAGAGLPDHLHWHVVPRWSGDTNFMAVLDGVRVIPESLTSLRTKLLAAGKELGLPGRP